MARTISKNFLSLLASNIVSILAGFFGIAYLARVLGPGDFGKISFAAASVVLVTLLADLGLPWLGIREIARDTGKVREYVARILPLRLLLAAIAFALLAVFALLLRQPLELKYLVLLYGLASLPAVLNLNWVFFGLQRMEYMAASQALGTVLYFALVVYLVRGPEQLLAIPLLSLAAATLLPLFLIGIIYVRRFGMVKLRFEPSLWKPLLRRSLPMAVPLLIPLIYSNADSVMLGLMKGGAEVGYYSAAYKVYFLIVTLGWLYYQALFPALARSYPAAPEVMRRLVAGTTRLMVTFALPVAVGGTILARPLIHLVFGTRYDPGIIAFQVLIWAMAVLWVGALYSQALLAADRQNRVAIAVSTGLAANLVLNFLLIPPLGAAGAAIATLFTHGIVQFWCYRELRRLLPVPFNGYLLRPLLASLGMAGFLYLFPHLSLFWLVPLGAAVYLALLLLMGGVTREELALLRRRFASAGQGQGG